MAYIGAIQIGGLSWRELKSYRITAVPPLELIFWPVSRRNMSLI
jgi:hypothetical protein